MKWVHLLPTPLGKRPAKTSKNSDFFLLFSNFHRASNHANIIQISSSIPFYRHTHYCAVGFDFNQNMHRPGPLFYKMQRTKKGRKCVYLLRTTHVALPVGYFVRFDLIYSNLFCVIESATRCKILLSFRALITRYWVSFSTSRTKNM